MFFELQIKGILVGFAFVIPRVSGGTLALYLGIYEKLVHSIGNIFKEFKKSMAFLIPVFLGIAISVIALAKLFDILLTWNSFVVIGFFIGLILGGIKQIYKEACNKSPQVSGIISFVIAFSIIIVLVIFDKIKATTGIEYIDVNFGNLILVFFLGMAASITMIVPGVSGSALLMVLGFYTAIVSNVVGNILDFSNIVYNLEIIIPFALGAGIGIIIFSRVIEHVLVKYKTQAYLAILGFIIASCIAVFFEIRDPSTAINYSEQAPVFANLFNYIADNILTVLLGLGVGVLGFFATRFLSKLEIKKETQNG